MVHLNAVDVMEERLWGEYKDEKMHGKGTYNFADGRNYTGDWVHGKKMGHGVFISTNGDRYKM